MNKCFCIHVIKFEGGLHWSIVDRTHSLPNMFVLACARRRCSLCKASSWRSTTQPSRTVIGRCVRSSAFLNPHTSHVTQTHGTHDKQLSHLCAGVPAPLAFTCSAFCILSLISNYRHRDRGVKWRMHFSRAWVSLWWGLLLRLDFSLLLSRSNLFFSLSPLSLSLSFSRSLTHTHVLKRFFSLQNIKYYTIQRLLLLR